MYKQIKFKITDPSIGKPDEILGGIGIFDGDNNLLEVICGCCGGVFKARDIKILRIYHNWIDLTDDILGNDEVEDE